jgi:hypothetical protein
VSDGETERGREVTIFVLGLGLFEEIILCRLCVQVVGESGLYLLFITS